MAPVAPRAAAAAHARFPSAQAVHHKTARRASTPSSLPSSARPSLVHENLDLGSVFRMDDASAAGARRKLDMSVLSLLRARDTPIDTVPAHYDANGLSPGVTAGVVLGSISGFLLCLWLLYSCINIGPELNVITVRKSKRSKSRSRRGRHSHHHRRSLGRRDEAIIVEDSVRPMPVERVVVEGRSASRGTPARGMPMPPPRAVVSDDDEEIVVQEHSPLRSHGSKSVRRESGFRPVDPDRFAAGDSPMKGVRRLR